MNRISRHQMWMEIAEIAAKRSTCYRANNGAVVARDSSIIAIGYNGSPPGKEHCLGQDCPKDNKGGCVRSVHAEQNALDRADIGARRASLYTTMSPCFQCASTAIDLLIGRVFFRYPYRVMDGAVLLVNHKIPVYRLTQNGDVVDYATGQLVDPASLD